MEKNYLNSSTKCRPDNSVDFALGIDYKNDIEFNLKNKNRLERDAFGTSFLKFNDIIGLPKKDMDGKTKIHPIYDYEIKLVDDIERFQHNWIKKARGLGITEIISRFLGWKCLATDDLQGKNIHIITGQTEKKAAALIKRIESILKKNYPDVKFESKHTILIINGCTIQAFPTKALKDLRGDVDVKYMFIDEADFFELAEQNELPYVIKSYEEKSDCKIIMVSTPNRPDGLFANIEKGKAFINFFKKHFLGYKVGLHKIFSTKFIKREMKSPEFEREYNLKYLGKIGNVFLPEDVDACVLLSKKYGNQPPSQYTLKLVGTDPGFSSSLTACYVAEFIDGILRIIEWERYEKETPSKIADDHFNIYVRFETRVRFLIDGSNAAFINEVKMRLNETLEWEIKDELSPEEHIVNPVAFSTEHKPMLEWLHNLIAAHKIAIPEECTDLIIALKTAWARGWDLDKKQSVNNDDLDALRLLCRGIRLKTQ